MKAPVPYSQLPVGDSWNSPIDGYPRTQWSRFFVFTVDGSDRRQFFPNNLDPDLPLTQVRTYDKTQMVFPPDLGQGITATSAVLTSLQLSHFVITLVDKHDAAIVQDLPLVSLLINTASLRGFVFAKIRPCMAKSFVWQPDQAIKSGSIVMEWIYPDK